MDATRVRRPLQKDGSVRASGKLYCGARFMRAAAWVRMMRRDRPHQGSSRKATARAGWHVPTGNCYAVSGDAMRTTHRLQIANWRRATAGPSVRLRECRARGVLACRVSTRAQRQLRPAAARRKRDQRALRLSWRTGIAHPLDLHGSYFASVPKGTLP